MEHSIVPMSEAKGAMGKKQLRKDWQRDARKYPSIFPFNLFSFHFYLLCFILFFFLLLTDNARKRWQKKMLLVHLTSTMVELKKIRG